MCSDSDLGFERCKVQTVPASAYYFSEWISAAEERALLEAVYAAPQPKWTQLSGRRVQNWGGTPTARGMVGEQLPRWLTGLLPRLPRPAPRAPNHVLVNEYRAGQGILAHEDGPLFQPAVATLSLGGSCVLRLLDRARAPVAALLLEPRSLLVLADDLYTQHLHGIDELHCDLIDDTICNLDLCSDIYVKGSTVPRDTRVSLTIRHVPKTSTFKLNIGNKLS
ncbi:alpha-ketoglutarate-dependent dioxygenase alkB homolog 6 [Pectinophora gossypiella]|uniref:alpha-ketoglutarate-dependent dioxygenase alkB homolog 6 n=1 Tax=Pectinophora gossypiella TaxID=13191 RepID=UPI00214E4B0A|nr:alpha-ketoglutarate-dependent dioxygenase alkB homolog 6 [Pectinophora gossypiella]